VLLVQGRGEMAVLPAVSAVLLHHSAMDTWNDCCVVSTGQRGNGGSACSYCSTVTSLNDDLRCKYYHNVVWYIHSASAIKIYIYPS